MGTIMDITFAKAKPGKDKFRPWILASIPLIVFGMIAFYSIPARMGGGIPMLVALFILKIIYEGGYTMMNIGMGSLLGAMATNDTERATLASARGMGSTVGGLVAGIIIPQVLARVGADAGGKSRFQIQAFRHLGHFCPQPRVPGVGVAFHQHHSRAGAWPGRHAVYVCRRAGR